MKKTAANSNQVGTSGVTQGSKTVKTLGNKSTLPKDVKKETKSVAASAPKVSRAIPKASQATEEKNVGKRLVQPNSLVLSAQTKKPVAKSTKLGGVSLQRPRTEKSEDAFSISNTGSANLPAKPQTLTTKRYEIIFNNYLVHLLNKLHELEELGYGEVKENLDHCFLKYSKLVDNNRIQEYLQHVHERFQPHIKLIAEQDDFLFATDYNQGDLRLISGLDLYNIWQHLDTLEHNLEFEEDELEREKCKEQAEKALNLKKTIWKSLTNLYVSSCLALGKTDDSWAISIMKNLRLAKQLEKEIEEEPDVEENDGVGGFNLPNIADFEKIFNSDNPLSKIINDVRNEINPEEYMRALNPENKPPLEVIMGLFSGQNKEGLQSVATSLGMKFEDKMKQRGYSEDDLKNAADGMKKDLSKIPGIGMLLSQFDTDAAKAAISDNLAGAAGAAGDAGAAGTGGAAGALGDASQTLGQTTLDQTFGQMPQPTVEQTEMIQNAFRDIQQKLQLSSENGTSQEDAIPMINNLFASLNANMQREMAQAQVSQETHLGSELEQGLLEQEQVQEQDQGQERVQEQGQDQGHEQGQEQVGLEPGRAKNTVSKSNRIPSDLPPDPIMKMLETMKNMQLSHNV